MMLTSLRWRPLASVRSVTWLPSWSVTVLNRSPAGLRPSVTWSRVVQVQPAGRTWMLFARMYSPKVIPDSGSQGMTKPPPISENGSAGTRLGQPVQLLRDLLRRLFGGGVELVDVQHRPVPALGGSLDGLPLPIRQDRFRLSGAVEHETVPGRQETSRVVLGRRHPHHLGSPRSHLPDLQARLRRLDDRVRVDIHPHVARVREARGPGNRLARRHPRHLLLRRARNVLAATRLPRPHRQTRAVEGVRAGATPLVVLAELLAGELDRLRRTGAALGGLLLRQERHDLVDQRLRDADQHLGERTVTHHLRRLVKDRVKDLLRAPLHALGQDVA